MAAGRGWRRRALRLLTAGGGVLLTRFPFWHCFSGLLLCAERADLRRCAPGGAVGWAGMPASGLEEPGPGRGLRVFVRAGAGLGLGSVRVWGWLWGREGQRCVWGREGLGVVMGGCEGLGVRRVLWGREGLAVVMGG